MPQTTVSEIFNPITGVFGTGNCRFFPGGLTTQTYTFVIPPGIGAVRVRVWGGGGYLGGSGGGFAIKSIYDLTGVTSVTITAGAGGNVTTTTGGTSSFGSFVSATGGAAVGGVAGTGVGGDLNYSGGVGILGGGGGGAAGLFGPGGRGGGGNGCAGGGSSIAAPSSGGHGFLGTGGYYSSNGTYVVPVINAQTGIGANFSLDFIATGGGGGPSSGGVNGGGGSGYVVAASSTANVGGFPGGGMGQQDTITTGYGGPGLVVVEW